jgi:hypothetical protein
MNAHQRQAAASNNCQQLCNDFLNSEYDTPDHSPFHGDLFRNSLGSSAFPERVESSQRHHAINYAVGRAPSISAVVITLNT